LRHLYWHFAARAPIRTKGFPHTHAHLRPAFANFVCLLFGSFFVLGTSESGGRDPQTLLKVIGMAGQTGFSGHPLLITQRVFKCSTFICIPLERVLYIQSEVSNVRVTNCWVKLTSFWLGTVFLCVAAGPPNRFFKYGQSRDQTYIHVFMNGVDNLRTVFSVHLNVHDLTPRRLFFTNAKQRTERS